MSTARIICGDVREVLPTLDPASFDVAIADPTYGETSLKWDKIVRGWPALVRPLLKPHGSLWVWGSFRAFWRADARPDFERWQLAQDTVWEKQNGSGFCTDRFMRVHELFVHFYPADVEWGGVYQEQQKMPGAPRPSARIKARGLTPHRGKIGAGDGYEYTDERVARSVMYERNSHHSAIHPTQKPLGIQQTIIRYSCPPGGNVLALFAGSGSTCVAAQREGRDSVGVEIDPDMCAKARAFVDGDAPLFTAKVGS